MALTHKQIALIHVAKSLVGMDEATYRTFLRAHAGVDSSKDLSKAQFNEVMTAFEGMGFARKERRIGMASAAQIGKIRALWAQAARNPTPQALRLFIERRFGVSSPEFLTRYRAQEVIEGIKRMKRAKDEDQMSAL